MIYKRAKRANKKSPTMKYIISLLKQVIKDIRNGECSEEELTDALSKFNPETKGYIKEGDFMNYDEAGKALGIGWNRTRLNNLCKKYHIVNHKFNNAHIGFSTKEILRLREIIKETGE
jgi:hypothetical protein